MLINKDEELQRKRKGQDIVQRKSKCISLYFAARMLHYKIKL